MGWLAGGLEAGAALGCGGLAGAAFGRGAAGAAAPLDEGPVFGGGLARLLGGAATAGPVGAGLAAPVALGFVGTTISRASKYSRASATAPSRRPTWRRALTAIATVSASALAGSWPCSASPASKITSPFAPRAAAKLRAVRTPACPPFTSGRPGCSRADNPPCGGRPADQAIKASRTAWRCAAGFVAVSMWRWTGLSSATGSSNAKIRRWRGLIGRVERSRSAWAKGASPTHKAASIKAGSVSSGICSGAVARWAFRSGTSKRASKARAWAFGLWLIRLAQLNAKGGGGGSGAKLEPASCVDATGAVTASGVTTCSTGPRNRASWAGVATPVWAARRIRAVRSSSVTLVRISGQFRMAERLAGSPDETVVRGILRPALIDKASARPLSARKGGGLETGPELAATARPSHVSVRPLVRARSTDKLAAAPSLFSA